jgi:4-hydroxybenzoate polyprenyltransferase
MIGRVVQILEMIRFSHTLFALPFALLAALMAFSVRASQQPPRPWQWSEVWGILLAMVFARSAAMAFNRLVDRDVDAENPRTQNRHIPAGLIGIRGVAIFTVVCSIGFVASTLLFWPENPWPLYLSVPVLAFLLSYSWAKRFTAAAHFWLGAALMLAPVCAWIAVLGYIDWPPVVLGGAVFFWVAGFDIIYACQDAQFDRAHGLHSVPARLGVAGALQVARLCHLGMVALLVLLPWTYGRLGIIYWIGLSAIAVLLHFEHRLVRPDDLTRVNAAFFNVNVIVSMGLLLTVALDLLT